MERFGFSWCALLLRAGLPFLDSTIEIRSNEMHDGVCAFDLSTAVFVLS